MDKYKRGIKIVQMVGFSLHKILKKKLENVYYLRVHKKQRENVISFKFKINIVSKKEKNGFDHIEAAGCRQYSISWSHW